MYYLARPRRDARVSARGGKRLAHTRTYTHIHTYIRIYTHTHTHIQADTHMAMYARACVLTPTRLHALRTVHMRANGESIEHAGIPSLSVYAVCGKLQNKVEPSRDRRRRQRVRLYRCRSRRRRRRGARFYRAASLRARRTNSRGCTIYTKGTFVKGEYRKMRAAVTSKTHERARRSPEDYLASRPFFDATFLRSLFSNSYL